MNNHQYTHSSASPNRAKTGGAVALATPIYQRWQPSLLLHDQYSFASVGLLHMQNALAGSKRVPYLYLQLCFRLTRSYTKASLLFNTDRGEGHCEHLCHFRSLPVAVAGSTGSGVLGS